MSNKTQRMLDQALSALERIASYTGPDHLAEHAKEESLYVELERE